MLKFSVSNGTQDSLVYHMNLTVSKMLFKELLAIIKNVTILIAHADYS